MYIWVAILVRLFCSCLLADVLQRISSRIDVPVSEALTKVSLTMMSHPTQPCIVGA